MGIQVKAVHTPWADAQDHKAIIENMNAILIDAGVTIPGMRRKMIAHSIIACGWKQKCWNHNAWAVKTGKRWTREFYLMDTKEEINGELVDVPNDAWRSFDSWGEAITDYLGRIGPDGPFESYREGGAILRDPLGDDKTFWTTIASKYATDTKNFADGTGFASICARVGRTIPELKKTAVPKKKA